MPALADRITVTDEQREMKDRLGFFITEPVFDDNTLAQLRHEFERIWQYYIEDTQQRAPERMWHARTRPFLSYLHRQSETLAAFLKHPLLVDLARQFVGPDADQTWNQAIVKPPTEPNPAFDRADNAFGWHQDARYAFTRPMDAGFTLWLAVTRTTIDNGTLWVLPGRHREGVLPHDYDERNHEWIGTYDTTEKIPVVLEPGQMLVFGRYVPHASGPNVTADEVRMAYQIGYGVPGIVYEETGKPFGDQIPILRGGEAA